MYGTEVFKNLEIFKTRNLIDDFYATNFSISFDIAIRHSFPSITFSSNGTNKRPK